MGKQCAGAGTLTPARKGGMPMRCPECGIEMRVENRSQTQGTVQLAFACRNKQCPHFGHIMAEKRLT